VDDVPSVLSWAEDFCKRGTEVSGIRFLIEELFKKSWEHFDSPAIQRGVARLLFLSGKEHVDLTPRRGEKSLETLLEKFPERRNTMAWIKAMIIRPTT